MQSTINDRFGMLEVGQGGWVNGGWIWVKMAGVSQHLYDNGLTTQAHQVPANPTTTISVYSLEDTLRIMVPLSRGSFLTEAQIP